MLLIRTPRSNQPQGTAEGNPDLALSSLVLPGQSDFDLISGERLSGVAATPTKGVGVFGPQLKFDASQEAVYGTATALQKGSGAAASIVWVGELFAAPDAYASLGGITYDAANNNPYIFVELKRNFASNNLFLSHSVGGSAANITNAGNYTSGFVVIVAAVTSGRQVMYSRSATVRERVSGTTTGSMSSTATSRLEIGESLNARNPQAACAMQAMSFRAWTDAELEQILDDPFGQVFARRSIWIPVSAAGGVSGTLAKTNANDTSAATGTTTVTGTLAKTNGSDTSAASGTTTIVGTLARSNANDTSAASGAVGSGVSGTVAYSNVNDTSAATGTTTVVGTSAATNANDSAVASGWAGTVSGTVAVTNENDTATASGVATQPAELTPQGGGGWLPRMRRKTRKELHAERVRLGILPPDVVKAAQKAAAVVLDEPSPVKAYRADPEAANKVFLRELGATKMLPDYTRAIQIQIELMQQEEEEILLLL